MDYLDKKKPRISKNLTEIGHPSQLTKKKSKYYGASEDDSIFKRKPKTRSLSKGSEFDIKFLEVPVDR